MWQYDVIRQHMPTFCHMRILTARDKVLRLARRRQGVSARELYPAGVHRQVLSRLVAVGDIERVARGIYRLPRRPLTEHHSLAVTCAAVPRGVVCLLSALQFHGIGTQVPHQVWLAIDRRSRKPALRYPPLRVVRYSGAALSEGVVVHKLEGQQVRVYGIAKTLADCFKYRHKIGLDVVLEAVREAWRERRFTMTELEHYAGICRVQRVMRPYLEAMLA
jgi:predicted transcriptional regulator of viral defense system